MPYVNIKITNEGVSPEKKAQLIEGATNLLKNVLLDPQVFANLPNPCVGKKF